MAFWDKITNLGNVEDRRGSLLTIGAAGIIGIAIAAGANLLSGGSIEDTIIQVINMLPQGTVEQVIEYATSGNMPLGEYEGVDDYELFAARVLGSGNDAWHRIFTAEGRTYIEPTLVLFRNGTSSACGYAVSAIGPFYCPADQTIYLDETFFDDLTDYYGARGGDVAQAYIIAHELGHHAQYLFGTISQAQESNEASVQIELQADCYAGIWANSLADKSIFEENEISEAMDAAAAVGDDRIQQRSGGAVTPETWTHGSSAQRVEWFGRGWNQGTLEACAI